MRRSNSVVGGVVLFSLGLALGSSFPQTPQLLTATQDEDGQQYSRDVLESYKKANKAVRELNNLFVASGDSTNAFSGINFFAASVGGVDAERDLEEGRGVDPETFAALYADMATPKISEHLDFDEQGRIRYKKNVVRIYSRDKLKQLFQERDQLEIRSESGK